MFTVDNDSVPHSFARLSRLLNVMEISLSLDAHMDSSNTEPGPDDDEDCLAVVLDKSFGTAKENDGDDDAHGGDDADADDNDNDTKQTAESDKPVKKKKNTSAPFYALKYAVKTARSKPKKKTAGRLATNKKAAWAVCLSRLQATCYLPYLIIYLQCH